MAGLATLLSGLILSRALARHLTRKLTEDLERQARLAGSVLRAEPDLPSGADEKADRIGRDLGLRVSVVAAGGRVLGDSSLNGATLSELENHAGRPEIAAAFREGSGKSLRYSTTLGEKMLYVARRIDPSDPHRGVVRLAVPLTAVRKAQERTRLPILMAAVLSALAAALLGAFAARSPAHRLREISKIASEIAAGRVGARAHPRGNDEVADLARSLNRMAADLESRLVVLARERNQLKTLLEGMVEGVLLTDAAGNILLANHAFESIFHAHPPLAGRRPLEAARVPALQEAVEAALAAEKPITREMSLGGASEVVIQASLAAIREEGQTVGAVAVFHDVTELTRLEKVRREFVGNVSHELRTPLTAIGGYAETLLRGGLEEPDRAREFVGVIQRHAERLQALIEDLLDLSAIEQGQARLILAPVSLREAASQAESAVRGELSRKGLSFVLAIPEGLPPMKADRDRLAQVLINLLDNAVKFTPEGGRITVSAASEGDRVVISVTDTGVGIAAGDLARIFERFYRAERSRDRRNGGTGLGLAIAKHLVQAMGGSIGVRSTPGRGSTFTIRLPSAQQSA